MDFEFIEDFHTDLISGKALNSMDDSELKKQSLHIKDLYSKALDEINKSVQEKNYDYCAAGVTRMQGVLEWKKLLSVVTANFMQEFRFRTSLFGLLLSHL